MNPLTALTAVALLLLALALGWRRLALKYQRQLRARRPPTKVWLVEGRAPYDQADLVGVYATAFAAERSLQEYLASGQAYYPPERYQVAELPVHGLREWAPA